MKTTLAAMAVAVALSLLMPLPAHANPNAAIVQQLVESRLASTPGARGRLVKLYKANPKRLKRFLSRWYSRVQSSCGKAKLSKAAVKTHSGSSLRGQRMKSASKFRTCATGFVRRNWQRFTRSIPKV